MLDVTKNWGYPTSSGPLPTEKQDFYEGSFLHMLHDKLSHILDQVSIVDLVLVLFRFYTVFNIISFISQQQFTY